MIIIGILILRPLKGGGSLIMGLHYITTRQKSVQVHTVYLAYGDNGKENEKLLKYIGLNRDML